MTTTPNTKPVYPTTEALWAAMRPRSLSGLTAWQIVRQSWLCHPDWSAEVHLAYLQNEEDVDVSRLGRPGETPRDCVNRWLEEHARPATPTTPATTPATPTEWATSKSGKLQIGLRQDSTGEWRVWGVITGTHDLAPVSRNFRGADAEAKARSYANAVWSAR